MCVNTDLSQCYLRGTLVHSRLDEVTLHIYVKQPTRRCYLHSCLTSRKKYVKNQRVTSLQVFKSLTRKGLEKFIRHNDLLLLCFFTLLLFPFLFINLFIPTFLATVSGWIIWSVSLSDGRPTKASYKVRVGTMFAEGQTIATATTSFECARPS